MTGLYIHIPFCPYRCNYCDFLSFTSGGNIIRKYVEYLLKEISLYKGKGLELDTIFIGGGTPSILESKYILEIMENLREVFTIAENAEISIEMNPNTLDEGKIRDYIKAGINRFSLGVQTFDSKILKTLGRKYSEDDIYEDIRMLRGLGAKNISVDMMLGNPGQDQEILRTDIDKLLRLDVDHISYYSLILEEGTMFNYWLQKGKISLLDDRVERDMYHYMKDKLSASSYDHYETSNFAKKGKRSRHNIKYWRLEDYIGIGLGSAGNIGLERYKNHVRLKEYFESLDRGDFPVMEREILSEEDREKEYIIMNLRLIEGFNLEEIKGKFSINFEEKYRNIVEKHIKLGNVCFENGYFKFTDQGLDLSNQFFVDII